jgi:hypothetical protein
MTNISETEMTHVEQSLTLQNQSDTQNFLDLRGARERFKLRRTKDCTNPQAGTL